MSTFKLPAEYESFVSSADYLLNEFKIKYDSLSIQNDILKRERDQEKNAAAKLEDENKELRQEIEEYKQLVCNHSLRSATCQFTCLSYSPLKIKENSKNRRRNVNRCNR